MSGIRSSEAEVRSKSDIATFEDFVDRKVCAIWRDEYRQIAKMLQGLYTALGAPSDS